MNTDNKKRVVFDAGGVLFADGSRALMETIASYGNKDANDVENYYREYHHQPLMRGEISESDFWHLLLSYVNIDPSKQAEIRTKFLNEILIELPPAQNLSRWHNDAELWILSNHTKEWLMTRLEAIGAVSLFHTIVISSAIGARKPEQAAFDHLSSSDKETIYIDDKQHNLDMASQMGYDTLIADSEGKWTLELDKWLAS